MSRYTHQNPLLIEGSVPGRRGVRTATLDVPAHSLGDMLGAENLRRELPMPELSELDVVRHYTSLSHHNYSIDSGFYPLGSCTMKYNPKVNDRIAAMPGYSRIHPLQPEETVQGALQIMYELQAMLAEIAGMATATLQPAAGAHAELLSLMMIQAYYRHRGEEGREVVLIPDSAHGTNPASAARCGFTVQTIKTGSNGNIDLSGLKAALSTQTAALMLTNPSTLGLFETRIAEICELAHQRGALVYCDGANMNALLGIARPGDMGFDVMHFNLHKTFSTPHGGGGPGGGVIAVQRCLEPFLPVPVIIHKDGRHYSLEEDRPHTIGRIHSFYGAFLVAVRAYAYIAGLGADGLREVAENAVLNANYIRAKIAESFPAAFPQTCMHEVVVSAGGLRRHGVKALDVSKRLIDYGFHPPTNYFPLTVPEALMIEPTETESKQTLDTFCEALIQISREAEDDPELLRTAPHHTPVSRLNETAAVKKLDVRWSTGG